MFIAGIGTLGVMVGLLAFVITREGPALSDSPFVVLGVVSGASALAIGASGARALRSLTGPTAEATKAISSRQIARSLPFQGLAFGVSLIAIFLIEAH